MIALYLLVCHLAGDFLLQTRTMAALKLTNWRVRLDHCVAYTVPFVVLALVVGDGPLQFYGFPAAIIALHFATDSRRFYSGPLEYLAYRISPPEGKLTIWRAYLAPPPLIPGQMPTVPAPTFEPPPADYARRMPPNPWPTLPFAIDQTLHVAQIALLAGLMLR